MRFIKYLLWTFSGVFFLVFLTIPVSPEAQMVMAVSCLVLVAFVKSLTKTGLWRIIAMSLTSAIVIRYVYWRTTSTLPSFEDPMSAIPGYLLYAAEMYSVMMLALSLFVVTKISEEEDAPHFSDDEAPTVDILIPTYNEPADLLAKTIMAASRIEYPASRRTIWLLDDGGTDQKCNAEDPMAARAARDRRQLLTRMCADLGATYLTRERNLSAKAGNLNNALQHASGDIVVVFDADHAPSPNFLRETIGFFVKDEDLAIIQTPHFFINPDPIERNLNLTGRMPSESEMFYSKIQRGLDHRGGAFFCGSAALLRRTALDEVGGFAGRSITEDCESTVSIHANGWKTRYVGKVMIAGLQPETFSSFIGQRSRWAQGMVQILMLSRPFMRRGLTLRQRLSYLSSILFWFFPASRLMFFVAPAFFLLFDLRIFTASGNDFLAYTVSYVVANLLLQNLLYGDVRRPWVSEIYEFAQSVHLGRAILSVIFSPTKPTFKVTSKDETADEHRRSDLADPFYALFFGLLALQGWAFYRMLTEPQNDDLILAVSLWNALNILLAGVALGAVNERPSEKPTITVSRPGQVTSPEGSVHDVRILAADEDGVLLAPGGVSLGAAGQVVTLTVPDHHRKSATRNLACPIRLAGGRGGEIRADYVPGIAALEMGCSLFYDNPEKWRKYDLSRKPRSVLMGTADFVALSLTQIIRGLGGAKLERRTKKKTSPAKVSA